MLHDDGYKLSAEVAFRAPMIFDNVGIMPKRSAVVV